MLKQVFEFLQNNKDSIDWRKIEKDIEKLNSNLKKSIIPPNQIQQIFANKSYFPNLNEIKSLFNKSFNRKLIGNSKKDILSEISYYAILEPALLQKIKSSISYKDTELIKVPSKKTTTQMKIVPIGESWEDWTKFKPNELKNHLKKLTIPQIKSISGSLLSSNEKRSRKADLIDIVVRKIEKLKAKYEMGPG